MAWNLDPRYVREDCYDQQLIADAVPHVDEVLEARLSQLARHPTSGLAVAGFPQMYVLNTRTFQVPTPAGPVGVPSLWIVYVLIPEDELIRPLYITRAANGNLQQLAVRALQHFRRANTHF